MKQGMPRFSNLPFPARAPGWAIALVLVLAGLPGTPLVLAATGTVALPGAAVQSAPQVEPDPLLAGMPDTFGFAAAQYQSLLERIRSGAEQPRTFIDGTLKRVGAKDWTSGFFPGSLWFLYEYTGDAKWKAAAQNFTRRLESVKYYRGIHDVGFMLNSSYGNGYRLTGDPAYRNVLVQGAHSLATRFSPTVGAIRSWDFGTWQYPVIIDNMMNLELLMWAAREAGQTRLRDIATRHADVTLKHHFRADGGSFHLVDFDPRSGAVLTRQTVQGAADSSTWSRGQAWGLYGYTIPDAPRDAAAAAIIAAALIELSTFVDPEFGAQCRLLARQQLLSLSAPAYLARRGENGGFLLMHSVGSLPHNTEVDAPLNYADYYFLQALLRYRKLAPRH